MPPVLAQLHRSEPAGSTLLVLVDAGEQLGAAFVAYQGDDLSTARHSATQAVREMESAPESAGRMKVTRIQLLHFAYDIESRVQYRSGDFAAAASSEAKAIAARKIVASDSTDDRRRLNELLTWLALAQAGEGQTGEAAQTIAPVVKFERGLAARNRGDRWVPQELAFALYVEALTDPAHRAALLHEAAVLMDGLAPEVRSVHDVERLRARILAAQRTPNG